MSAAKKKVLVTGATGQIGQSLLPYLRADASVDLIAGVRNLKKALDLGVETVYLDLDRFDTITPALRDVDRIFLVTGYTVDMLKQSKDVIDAATKVGVEQIVHLGACRDNETHIGHYGWHQFIERYIASSGIRFYTHLRPEMFMQNLLGYGGAAAVKDGVIHHYIGDAKWSWVDADDIAAVAAAALLHPEKHHGHTYRMGYEAKGFNEIAQVMTSFFGKPYQYKSLPAEEFYKNVLAAGGEPAYMKCVYECFRDFTTGALKAEKVFDNFPLIVGRAPTTIAQFIEKNADAFRY